MYRTKIGVGLWCINFAADRFLPTGYREMKSLKEQIEMAGKVDHVETIDLHSSDFGSMKPSEVAKIVTDNNLKIYALNPNIFGDPIFKYGAFSNTDKAVRRKAIDLTKATLDLCQEVGASVCSLWPGQDGTDYYFQNDYRRLWENSVNSLKEVCAYAPKFKICYEYKPYEPRQKSFIGNAAEELLLLNDVNAENLGITLDYGHSKIAGENVAKAVSMVSNAKKLFHVHYNDNYGGWDDDLIVGSVDIWSNIEFLWYLKQTDYKGYLTLDMFPYREDPLKACSLSTRMIRTFEDILDTLDDNEINALQNANDAVGILEMLRKKVLSGNKGRE
jgi:xylose isomerase